MIEEKLKQELVNTFCEIFAGGYPALKHFEAKIKAELIETQSKKLWCRNFSKYYILL